MPKNISKKTTPIYKPIIKNISCERGKYLTKNFTCEICHSDCLTCVYSANNCTTKKSTNILNSIALNPSVDPLNMNQEISFTKKIVIAVSVIISIGFLLCSVFLLKCYCFIKIRPGPGNN